MPYPPFTETDLLLGDRALDDLHAARLNKGLTQPLQDVIDGAVATVQRYTARYRLGDDHFRKLVRALAIQEAMSFPGMGVPPAIKDAGDRAMSELKDILGNKFADVLEPAPADSAPAVEPRGAFGSQTKIVTWGDPNE